MEKLATLSIKYELVLSKGMNWPAEVSAIYAIPEQGHLTVILRIKSYHKMVFKLCMKLLKIQVS